MKGNWSSSIRHAFPCLFAIMLTSVSGVVAQNVGIGFSNPQSKLTVNGNLAVGADYNNVAPTNGAIIEGFTGIGTKSPQQLLHVFNGDIYLSTSSGSLRLSSPPMGG